MAGAAVTTVIKSGSNTHHGEFFTDFKPGGSKGYTGAEKFLRYLDINGQLGGPLIKDRFWYFTSFRGQQTASITGMYDKPAAQGGTQGQLFTTETTDYTLKLNYQLSRQKHPDVHDAVGQETSALSVRFRPRRLSIPCRVDGAFRIVGAKSARSTTCE